MASLTTSLPSIPRPHLTTLPPSTSSHPGLSIPTRQSTSLVQGIPTNVVCQSFSDRILVLVTQRRRLGCLIQAKLSTPAAAPTSSSSSSQPFQLPPIETLHLSASSSSPEPSSSGNGDAISPTSSPLPSLLPSIDLQPLLGSPPPGQDALYSLYASSIASLIASSSVRTGGGEAGQGDPRPIIVGLALKDSEERNRSAGAGIDSNGETSSSQTNNEDQGLYGEEEEWNEVQDEERQRFTEVIRLVRQCCVW